MLGKKCQIPIAPPVSAIARACSRLICRPVSGVGPIAGDPESAVCERSNGLVATLTAALTVSSVACATSQTNPSRWHARMTSAPNEVKPMMGNHPGLEIPNVVGSIVDELDVPDTALMGFLEPL